MKSEKQEEQIERLTTDNKTMNKLVDLEADIIAGSSTNFQQQMQQQQNQKAVVEALEARNEELEGLVKTLSSESDALHQQNVILTKDLSDKGLLIVDLGGGPPVEQAGFGQVLKGKGSFGSRDCHRGDQDQTAGGGSCVLTKRIH